MAKLDVVTKFRSGVVTKLKVGIYDQFGRCDQQQKLEVVTKLGIVTNDKLGVMIKTESWALLLLGVMSGSYFGRGRIRPKLNI